MASASPPPLSPTKKSSQELPNPPPISHRAGSHSERTQAEPSEPDDMAVDASDKEVKEIRSQVRTPEPQQQLYRQHSQTARVGVDAQTSPSTPGHIPPFDWEEFGNRYEQALSQANEQEKELLAEFDRLVKYFNIWASAASAHDNERAVKRLQTRERFVKIAEQSLDQKKQHLTEVVRAFQSALALLSQ